MTCSALVQPWLVSSFRMTTLLMDTQIATGLFAQPSNRVVAFGISSLGLGCWVDDPWGCHSPVVYDGLLGSGLFRAVCRNTQVVQGAEMTCVEGSATGCGDCLWH